MECGAYKPKKEKAQTMVDDEYVDVAVVCKREGRGRKWNGG